MSHPCNDELKEQLFEQVLDEFPNLSEYECLKIATYRYDDHANSET